MKENSPQTKKGGEGESMRMDSSPTLKTITN